MQNFNVTVSELLARFQDLDLLTGFTGNGGTILSRLSAVESCLPGDLVFADRAEYFSIVSARRPAAVVTSSALKSVFSTLKDLVIFEAPNLSLAHAKIKKYLSPRDFNHSGWAGVHSSAVIHDSVFIGEGTVIEPGVIIARETKIGCHCRIMAGTVIEDHVVIGDRAVIHPSVVIGYGSILGDEVVIGSGSVIGSEGYGFAQDGEGKSHPIPQTGIVVLEDRVRVGANNCIDRAAYFETRIGAGTKLDNLCHIAHNVQIGQDCLLTSMFCVAGSAKIGNRVVASGQAGVLDHVKICDDVVLLHRAGVGKDILKPGAYAGAPVQILSEYMKNTAVLRSAVELRKRIGELEKGLPTNAG